MKETNKKCLSANKLCKTNMIAGTLQGGYPLQLSPGDKRRGNVVWRRRRWRRGNVVGKRSKKLQLAGRGPWMNGFCKDQF